MEEPKEEKVSIRPTAAEIHRASDDDIFALSSGEKLRLSIEAERALGKRDTYYLTKHILGYDKLNDTFHRAMCRFFDQHINEVQLHLHPRGHYKTTCQTIGGKTRLALMNSNTTIMIIANTIQNAESFLREIKMHFIANEKFRRLYPEHAVNTRKEEGTSDAFTTPARTKPWIRMHTFEAVSIDKALVSRHFLHGHYDDIVDNLNINTSDLRRKVLQAYSDSLSLIDGKTPLGLPWHHMVGTRWHMDDAWGHLIDERHEQLHIFLTQAIWKEPDPAGGYRTRILFPEEFSEEKLDFIRKKQGPAKFSALYLNNPVPSDEAALDPDFIQYYDQSDIDDKRLRTVITVDPASSYESRQGDPTVIAAFSMDTESNLYVREIRRGWWNPDEIVSQILDTYKVFNTKEIGIEAVAFSKWLCFYVDKAKKDSGFYFNVIPIKRDAHQKKHIRQERIIPFHRNRKIFFRKDEPEMEIVLREMREYPSGRYDDFLDTLTDSIEMLKPPAKRKKRVEIRRPNHILEGVNFQTGYNYHSSNV
jgi:hypothetical protein